MNPDIAEFINFLENYDEDWDYGDFKRQGDLYLQRMIESLGPLSNEQSLQLQRLREKLLWSYQEDVGEMRQMLKQATGYLQSSLPPEL